MPDIPPFLKPEAANDEKCLPWNLSAIQSVTVSAPALKVSSKARNEYEKACDAFHGKKFVEAERYLRAAIAKFQDYPAAWVLLGVVLDEQHKEQEARDACSHASTISGKYLPAYLCVAEFAARNREWEQLLTLANTALGLNSEKNGYAYYYQAMAYFNRKDLVAAKKSALHAAEIDTNHSYLPLYFLLAQIYEAAGDKATAATYLRQTLKHTSNREQQDAIAKYLAALEAKPSASTVSNSEKPGESLDGEPLADFSAGGTVASMAELAETDESWLPADIDHADLLVAPGVACPQQTVLDGASRRILEIVRNVDRFTATEMLIHQAVDRSGREGPPVAVQFNYLVSITPGPQGYLKVDEFRNGSLSREGFPNKIATVGTPSLVLIFHPRNIDNFEMECEGLGHWHGEPAWQVRFEQRDDRPNLTSAFLVGQEVYRVNLRGRAWILADSFQVARLETDLKNTIPKIRLHLEHLSIEYRPVKSPMEEAQLWLPSSAELYMNFQGRRFHRKHVFTDFKIFSVDSKNQIADPKKTVDAP
jgi:tetratricopeptide (TPR) repeat protein